MAGVDVVVVTTNEMPGHRVITVYGEVVGIVVQVRDMFSNLGARMQAIAGGEVAAYTQMMLDARREAHSRLCQAADDLGANAVLAARYTVSDIGGIMQEVAAFGTAVTVAAFDDPAAVGHVVTIVRPEVQVFSAGAPARYSDEDSLRYRQLDPAGVVAMREVDRRVRAGELSDQHANAERARIQAASATGDGHDGRDGVGQAGSTAGDGQLTRAQVQHAIEQLEVDYRAGAMSFSDHRKRRARLKDQLTSLPE